MFRIEFDLNEDRRHSHHGRHFAHGFGRPHHHGRRGEIGFGRGRERLFEAGDIKLVILALLEEQPSYGYQLMKRMEERLAGGYSPSAGVIYPTLTLLEEEGLTEAVEKEDKKKVYRLTQSGTEYLSENRRQVESLFERMEEAGRGFHRERSPELVKAFRNLRGAIDARLHRESATPDQISKIAEAINAAAKTIDEL